MESHTSTARKTRPYLLEVKLHNLPCSCTMLLSKRESSMLCSASAKADDANQCMRSVYRTKYYRRCFRFRTIRHISDQTLLIEARWQDAMFGRLHIASLSWPSL